jgi:hypothetical protein
LGTDEWVANSGARRFEVIKTAPEMQRVPVDRCERGRPGDAAAAEPVAAPTPGAGENEIVTDLGAQDPEIAAPAPEPQRVEPVRCERGEAGFAAAGEPAVAPFAAPTPGADESESGTDLGAQDPEIMSPAPEPQRVGLVRCERDEAGFAAADEPAVAPVAAPTLGADELESGTNLGAQGPDIMSPAPEPQRVPVGRCDEQGGAAEDQQTAAPRDEPPSGADENTVWVSDNTAAGFVERGAL